MRIVFDPTFDATPWPGPLAGRVATAGEAWAGPRYLLNLLETQLGLGGPPVPAALRAASLVPVLRATAGFWSESAAVDPLGTARLLLDWRDALWMAGWRGQPLGERRLGALAEVTAGALPGMPDRIAAVGVALQHRAADVEEVILVEPTEDLPAAWRVVLDGLRAGGTRVGSSVLAPAEARGDLAAAQRLTFTPTADGSLQLLRPHGPLQAAEEVAAWLGARGEMLAETVVIGADPVLDAALRRHGLPTAGSTRHARDNALMQILPLTLALGWAPPDPERALELLTLAVSPVPRGVAWRLARALHEQPAVDSDPWRARLREGLDAIEAPADRARIAERLALLFDGRVPRGGKYPAAEIRRRLDVLDVWARGRMSAAGEDRPAWSALLGASLSLRALVDVAGLDGLDAPELERFLEEALDSDQPLAAFPAEAGLAAVQSPGAVAGPAACVVWWSFDLASVPAIPVLPLTRGERRALAAAGVALPDPGELAVAAAARWRRPLQQVTDALLLVCPQTSADGTERHPHPLWDELEADLADGASLAALERVTPFAAPTPARRGARALPEPRRVWTVAPATLRARTAESPSSLAALVGCSFKWAATYQGGVWQGGTAALPQTERMLGTLTHVLIARVLGEGITVPDEAAARAEALFDAEGARIAAPLFLPGFDASRADARKIVVLAARELVRLLAAANLAVHAVETPVARDTPDGRLAGTPDLVVGPPYAVIDLKWSGARFRRDQLKAGTAYQLAAYAQLVADPGARVLPPTGYFIVRDQRLLTTDGALFHGADPVDGPPVDVTWDALLAAQQLRRAALAAGTVEAPALLGVDGQEGPDDEGIVDGVLTLTPPCGFCELHALCGRFYDPRFVEA